ncbi:hypothetical protein COV18_04065 [Candidatus Woesearchaeota archaeon CG10_big_fil_rev_8_21_14_0_10_37_12]|nr:MAG: hypothetical protein COV18_04065 [Candidatus Woesearchaeota archaeon CG10_big_fil_rev_8_21_14_0_10_37_12]
MKKIICLGLLLSFLLACSPDENKIKIGVSEPFTGPGEFIGERVKNGTFVTISERPVLEEDIKIGLPTLLSGTFAAAGQNMINAAELAIAEHKGNLNVKLVVEDAGCGENKGLTATKKLVEVDEVVAVIGGTCSDDTMASAQYVNEEKIPYITPVTGGSNIDNAGEYIFRLGNADKLAGVQPAQDFINHFNFTSAAIVTEQREYTIDIRDHFVAEFEKLSGIVVLNEEFEPDSNDFRTLLLKIKKENPDAIVMLSQLGATGGYFVKQARELGLEQPIVTTFTTVTNTDAQAIAGEFMEGVYFYDPDYDVNNPDWRAFLKKYKETYNTEPAIPFHAAATYDTTRIILEAIKSVGNDGEKVHDWMLEHVKDYKGFMGAFSFDEKGNTNNGFVLKQVQNGDFVEVKE